jgi:hypothetical protein
MILAIHFAKSTGCFIISAAMSGNAINSSITHFTIFLVFQFLFISIEIQHTGYIQFLVTRFGFNISPSLFFNSLSITLSFMSFNFLNVSQIHVCSFSISLALNSFLYKS